MAKSGIDYFPLDVSLDKKFELIEAEFGLTGFGVVVHLLQEIYGKEGYYIEWTKEVALLFARRCGVGGGVVSQIVEASVRRGMFDKEIYDKYRVLTSKGIQKRYFEAVSRRKSLEVDYNILLVDPTQICKDVNISAKNVNISPENADISEQSKVEKSRVKESKVKKSKECANAHSMRAREAEFDLFWKAYPKKRNKADALSAFLKIEGVNVQTILDAIERFKGCPEWKEQDGRFIPYPAKWLKAKGWEDELAPQFGGERKTVCSKDDIKRLREIYNSIAKGEQQ